LALSSRNGRGFEILPLKREKRYTKGMSEACVLLEAFKQLIDPVSDGGKKVDIVEGSQKGASKAKEMLARLCKKREAREATAMKEKEKDVPSTVPSVASSPILTSRPEVSILFYTTSGLFQDNRLRISLSSLHAITKGANFFTADVADSISMLKQHLTTHKSANVVVSSDGLFELRDVYDVKYYSNSSRNQTIVEFSLSEVQASNTEKMKGEVVNLQVFIGHL